MSMKHVCSQGSKTKISGVDENAIQPNAIDLRLGKVFIIRPNTFILSEEEKIHRGSVELRPDANGWFTLVEGHYEVVMENIITVGENEAGWVITRSTLNRNGVFLTSGLYDTGYTGIMAGVMHVTCGPMRIQRGTRIGQYLSFDAEALHAYNGSYGLGTEDDKKYGVVSETEAPKRSRGRPKKTNKEG